MRSDDQSVFAAIQEVVGTRYNRSQHNKDIIDTFVLRKARQKGIRLPTGGPPDEYKYLGAHVETPTAGTSHNVVYIDVSSMYPNFIVTLNASPETLIGTRNDLAQSQYTESDCVWGYIDSRDVYHLEKGEPYQHLTNGQYKMVYDPRKSSTKWTCDEGEGPRYEKLYFLNHDTQKGFLTECVEELIALKNRYRGTSLYGSTKRVTNSVYGTLGYANSSSSFRLFDWRLAEAITLSGRKMIQHSRDYVLEYVRERGYEDAYAALGDSVPGDETVVVRDLDENVDVRRIEDLYDEVGQYSEWTGYEVWTENGFTPVHQVIQKPNRKTMYRIRTKNGVVHATEDHSLVLADGTEVSPEEVSEGDELLHENVGYSLPNVPDPDNEISKDLAWLLGLFVADGSCGVYESNGEKKRPWAISKDNYDLLNRAGEVLRTEFDVDDRVCDYRESSGCYKLKATGFDKGDRIQFVDWFRERCYDGDEKQVPVEVLNGSEAVRRSFLKGYHDGDGYVRAESVYDEVDSMQFRDRVLAQGIAMLVEQAGYDVTIDCRDNHGEEYYRIRTVSFHRGSPTEVRAIEKYEYDGEYVYDLETENHHFQAGVGDIIVHNTDGVGIALPSASTRHEAMGIIEDAVAQLNSEGYDEFFAQEFNVDPQHHRGEIEIESYAPKVFVPSENPPHGEVGKKKRYITWETWNDDDGECNDISITGLEAQRSDVAPVTTHAQQLFADLLREDDGRAREVLFPQLRELAESIQNGEIDLTRVCKRSGVGQDLSEYGSPTRRASTFYRGAKYATNNIEGVTIQHGDKPALVYISDVRGEYPSVYDTDTAEDGDVVDAVTVPDPSKLPEGFVVDWEKHFQKTLKETMEPLLETRFGGNIWSEILDGSEQVGFEQFAQ